MLAIDSLVIDLIFEANAEVSPEALLEAIGGEEVASERQLIDPDMQDPRFELELSPSMPFRRRGERRLLIVDASVAPMRPNPEEDSLVEIDLRPEKERLIGMCEALPVRAARLSGLGVWGSAVMVARSARDLRGLCLILWALDPHIDVAGRRRATPLGRPEFEEKLTAYDKRLEELDEKQILADIGPAKLERRGEFLVLDVLDGKGHWELMDSLRMEGAVAATERFSVLPGAPAGESRKEPEPEPEPEAKPEPAPTPEPESESTGDRPSLGIAVLEGRPLLLFPRERFDLDVAAAIGKKDWESVLISADPIGGRERDQLYADGGDFVAPLEFLSEVFLEGIPLSRGVFDEHADRLEDGTRTMHVHCPRFGRVLLIDLAEGGRFISSVTGGGVELHQAIVGHYGAS